MFHQFNKIFFELLITEEEKAEREHRRARAMDEAHDFFRRKIQEDFDSILDSLRALRSLNHLTPDYPRPVRNDDFTYHHKYEIGLPLARSEGTSDSEIVRNKTSARSALVASRAVAAARAPISSSSSSTVESAAIGYMTGSPILGGIFGGDMVGGIIGSYLRD